MIGGGVGALRATRKQERLFETETGCDRDVWGHTNASALPRGKTETSLHIYANPCRHLLFTSQKPTRRWFANSEAQLHATRRAPNCA